MDNVQDIRVLAVDDDERSLGIIRRLMNAEDVPCDCYGSGEEALSALASGHQPFPDVIVTDLRLPGVSGTELIDRFRVLGVGAPVVVVTAEGSIQEAVNAMRVGAFDFLTKPFDPLEQLMRAVGRAASYGRRQRDSYVRPMGSLTGHAVLLGSSSEMKKVRQLIDAVSGTDTTVLITGETGTGKELVARMIHERSGRPVNKFVPVNCGALSPTVLESELFGHARGAFTGAHASRPGLLVTASGGTLFLDEVSELALAMQARLLRVLQESEVRAVGADRSRTIDARVLAASNRPLKDMVASGEFRQDLFYRLNVFEVFVPPLRERRSDVFELVEHFLHKYAVHMGRSVPAVDSQVLHALYDYDWPGNVRQLEHVIERALILCDERIESIHLSLGTDRVPLRAAESGRVLRGQRDADGGAAPLRPLRTEKDDFEKNYLRALMASSNNNRAEAARVAHLDPSNLRRLLKRHGLL